MPIFNVSDDGLTMPAPPRPFRCARRRGRFLLRLRLAALKALRRLLFGPPARTLKVEWLVWGGTLRQEGRL